MSITAKELAGKLGISASAVSIALNGKKGISDEKRDFILRAAKEYGLKRPLLLSILLSSKSTAWSMATRLSSLP